MLKTICRNVAVKLPNNKNFVYAVQNLDTQKIKTKKYEMSESHNSPFLVYTKDDKKLFTHTENILNTQMKNTKKTKFILTNN